MGITIGELANKKDIFIDDLFYYEGQKKIKTRLKHKKRSEIFYLSEKALPSAQELLESISDSTFIKSLILGKILFIRH